MKIVLNKLTIENFKGLKRFILELDGENVTISAQNGIGKTTIYDSFLWLLFDKDSTGRKSFEVRPLDANNQPIKGLVTAVEAELEMDGTAHVFRKELREKIVKKEFRGYETLTTIDEVPKKIGEYSEYIEGIIPEETFKLLTDLNYFNAKMHWKDRRHVLLQIAGEIGTPDGYGALLKDLNGRTIDEYKLVLAGQKKRYEKERDEINPRIDEIQKGLSEYASEDLSAIETSRDSLKAEIVALDKQRQEVFTKEKLRSGRIDNLNLMKSNLVNRECQLKNDTGHLTPLLEEKAQLESGVALKKQAVSEAQTAVMLKETQIKGKKSEMEMVMVSLRSVQDQYKKARDAKTDDTCYACGQKLPADQMAEVEKKRAESLASIAKEGNAIKAKVDACKAAIADLETGLSELREIVEKKKIELADAEEFKASRMAEIDTVLTNRPAPDFKQDTIWQNLNSDIQKLEKAIGPSMSEQLQTIDNQRTEKQTEVAALDKYLASADRSKADKLRITELEAKEKELAQKIADVEKQLAKIDRYNMEYSRMIETAVNDKFEFVEFKLFNYLLNGSIEETCEATYNGVPYSDLSTGQQIFAGIDIVNVLSAHYGLSVCLFVDHLESLTMPLKTDTQVIGLKAVEGIKKLTVERKETANV